MNVYAGAFAYSGTYGNTQVRGAAWGAAARGAQGSVAAGGFVATRQNEMATANRQASANWCRLGAERPLGQKESFNATIKGDPHFTVDGSINGQEVSAKFDNQDLGTRTQYAGAGFKLDTTTVPWGQGGAAVVDSATVTTGFGRGQKDVTVNADGSVLVGGQAVSLEQGQSMNLNRTSSLAYNDDGTYTVSSRNGKVTNTFDIKENSNGNYLNIESSVNNVQTVGWLQQQV